MRGDGGRFYPVGLVIKEKKVREIGWKKQINSKGNRVKEIDKQLGKQGESNR